MGLQVKPDSFLKTLNEAKANSGLPADDPSVVALEEIVLARVASLHAEILGAALPAEAVVPAPALLQTDPVPVSRDLPVLFSPIEEDPMQQPASVPNKTL